MQELAEASVLCQKTESFDKFVCEVIMVRGNMFRPRCRKRKHQIKREHYFSKELL